MTKKPPETTCKPAPKHHYKVHDRFACTLMLSVLLGAISLNSVAFHALHCPHLALNTCRLLSACGCMCKGVLNALSIDSVFPGLLIQVRTLKTVL